MRITKEAHRKRKAGINKFIKWLDDMLVKSKVEFKQVRARFIANTRKQRKHVK